MKQFRDQAVEVFDARNLQLNRRRARPLRE